ncbi:MAG TPA: hypothetical protein VIL43_00085, partial [Burkholderiales bacterium]
MTPLAVLRRFDAGRSVHGAPATGSRPAIMQGARRRRTAPRRVFPRVGLLARLARGVDLRERLLDDVEGRIGG